MSLFIALVDRNRIIGLQDGSDATIETLKTIEHPISKQAQILVEACSFAGSGNVLRVQAMLHHCDEHVEKEKEKEKETEENKDDKDKEEKKDEPKVDDTFQAFAVLGIALIAMGEDIGAEMSMRQFNHLVGRSNLSEK
jgi:26S proteasome regulatory subunit N1